MLAAKKQQHQTILGRRSTSASYGDNRSYSMTHLDCFDSKHKSTEKDHLFPQRLHQPVKDELPSSVKSNAVNSPFQNATAPTEASSCICLGKALVPVVSKSESTEEEDGTPRASWMTTNGATTVAIVSPTSTASVFSTNSDLGELLLPPPLLPLPADTTQTDRSNDERKKQAVSTKPSWNKVKIDQVLLIENPNFTEEAGHCFLLDVLDEETRTEVQIVNGKNPLLVVTSQHRYFLVGKTDVTEVTRGSDVLPGRGGQMNDWNAHYREVIREYQPIYAAACKRGFGTIEQSKHDIAHQILNLIESKGGRFLDAEGRKLSKRKTITKISSALKDSGYKRRGRLPSSTSTSTSTSTSAVAKKKKSPPKETFGTIHELPSEGAGASCDIYGNAHDNVFDDKDHCASVNAARPVPDLITCVTPLDEHHQEITFLDDMDLFDKAVTDLLDDSFHSIGWPGDLSTLLEFPMDIFETEAPLGKATPEVDHAGLVEHNNDSLPLEELD